MASVSSRGNKTTELRLLIVLKIHRVTGWRRHYPILGRPDFSFPRARVALFVDGCFWHGCPRCYSAPKNNKAYWRKKRAYNAMHDRETNLFLRQAGWRVVRVWEHELRFFETAAARIVAALKAGGRPLSNRVSGRGTGR